MYMFSLDPVHSVVHLGDDLDLERNDSLPGLDGQAIAWCCKAYEVNRGLPLVYLWICLTEIPV